MLMIFHKTFSSSRLPAIFSQNGFLYSKKSDVFRITAVWSFTDCYNIFVRRSLIWVRVGAF